MVRPFEDKMKAVEKEIAQDHARLQRLLKALRTLAKEDKRLASILQNFSLM